MEIVVRVNLIQPLASWATDRRTFQLVISKPSYRDVELASKSFLIGQEQDYCLPDSNWHRAFRRYLPRLRVARYRSIHFIVLQLNKHAPRRGYV